MWGFSSVRSRMVSTAAGTISRGKKRGVAGGQIGRKQTSVGDLWRVRGSVGPGPGHEAHKGKLNGPQTTKRGSQELKGGESEKTGGAKGGPRMVRGA